MQAPWPFPTKSKRCLIPTIRGKSTQLVYSISHLSLRARRARDLAVLCHWCCLSRCLRPFLQAVQMPSVSLIVYNSLPNHQPILLVLALHLRTHQTRNLHLPQPNQYSMGWKNPQMLTPHSNLLQDVSALFWPVVRCDPPPAHSIYDSHSYSSKQR
jgi:hypothetical protein